MEEISVSSLQNELAERQRKIEEQERVIHKLKNELNEFLSELYWRTPVNERNAGRRSIITPQLKEDVHKLKNEGRPIKAVAIELGISVGTVHKILHLPARKHS